MVMTYTSLVGQITSYLNRSDAATLAQIPNFISQAEQRIALESKNIGMETYVIGTMVTGVSTLQKPARWRRSLSFSCGVYPDYNERKQLSLRSYEYIRDYWPNPILTAMPLYYADYGYDYLLLGPTPDQPYPFEFCYLQLPEPITAINQTNWLTINAPQVLLYAALLESTPFLKNDERIGVWQAFYDRGIQALNAQDDQRVVDRASNRGAD